MQKGARPLDAVGLTFVSSPTCIATTMAFHFANGEFVKLGQWLKHERAYGPGAMAGFLLIGGLLGFSYDLVHNQYVKMTSAVTMGSSDR